MRVKNFLAALCGHSGFGVRGVAHLEHDLDAAPGGKIATRRAACGQAGQGGRGDTGNAVDQCIDIGPAHQLALLLHQAQLQYLDLDLAVVSVSLTARRLPRLASQVS